MCLSAVLKILWVGWYPVKSMDVPRNVDSPENLAALPGVFGIKSGHPSLCLSGALLFKGWAPLVALNTEDTPHCSLKCLECSSINYITVTLRVFIHFVYVFFEDVLHRLLSDFLVWRTFGQIFGPLNLVLRQQQHVTQVSTVMSRTTTAGEQIKTASLPAHS